MKRNYEDELDDDPYADGFDEWYDKFLCRLADINYTGPVDKHAAEADYNDGTDPIKAADDLAEDW